MSFQELVRQSMKTKEQVQQEHENEKQRIFNEENERVIKFYLEYIASDILSMASTGKFRNNEIHNTLWGVPARDEVPYFLKWEFLGIKVGDRTLKYTNNVFIHCKTDQDSMTVSEVVRLKLIFDEVKKRALKDRIEVSDPYILVEIYDCRSHTVKTTRKVMMQNNMLSATYTTKETYNRQKKYWEGEYHTFSLAFDYHYTV